MTLPHGFGSPKCKGFTRASCPNCNPSLRKSKKYSLIKKLLFQAGFIKVRRDE